MTNSAQQVPLASASPQHLIIYRGIAGDHETTRFFFTDTLDPQLFKLVVRSRLTELPGVLPSGGVRRYDNYLAVQWSMHLVDAPRSETERIRQRIEATVIEVLCEAFGWVSPVISHWQGSQAELAAKGRRWRVNWHPGSL